jgi:hypothetical protein
MPLIGMPMYRNSSPVARIGSPRANRDSIHCLVSFLSAGTNFAKASAVNGPATAGRVEDIRVLAATIPPNFSSFRRGTRLSHFRSEQWQSDSGDQDVLEPSLILVGPPKKRLAILLLLAVLQSARG